MSEFVITEESVTCNRVIFFNTLDYATSFVHVDVLTSYGKIQVLFEAIVTANGV